VDVFVVVAFEALELDAECPARRRRGSGRVERAGEAAQGDQRLGRTLVVGARVVAKTTRACCLWNNAVVCDTTAPWKARFSIPSSRSPST
jgi:hypothetical protein